ncbi:MAG: hypothetical protein AAF969_16160 [Bacteroidota bacterium]
MKTCSYFIKISLLLIVVFLMACSAEDGAVGPQGPQGPQGEQGIQGPVGNDGTDGIDGIDANSTVISSGWFEINTWDTDLSNFKFQRIPDLILTEFQKENSVILVYRRYQLVPTFNTIDLLPFYELDVANGSIGLAIQSKVSGNGLFLQVQSFGRALVDEEFLGPETQFRYMVIEPASTADKSNIPDYSKMTYEEVIELLGINP